MSKDNKKNKQDKPSENSSKLLANVTSSAKAAGVQVSVDEVKPMVCLDGTISQIANELGLLLRNRGLFLRNGVVVEVDEKTGLMKPMSAERFCSWVEDPGGMLTYKQLKDARKSVTMGKDMAAKILASPSFLRKLKVIEAVAPVRMPVLREDGKVELLPRGYDEQTRTYVLDGVKYNEELDFEEARDWLEALIGDYPWAGLDAGDLRQNRSVAVHMAAMLGVYCRLFFPPGTPRPMMVYLGNQPGVGKSTLVAMALAPVFGAVASDDLPRSDEERHKILATKAMDYEPVVWFDDLPAGLNSAALNRFIIANAHKGRILGSNTQYHVPNVTQTFVTGNQIPYTSDLNRRSLVVDLFLAGEVESREFSFTVTPTYLVKTDVRSMALSCLWALVREWAAEAAEYRVQGKRLPSFEGWTGTIGGMVKAAGFIDPATKPELTSGGDEEGDEVRSLLVALADYCNGLCVIKWHGGC